MLAIYAKRYFYCTATDTTFGKVATSTSEEVMQFIASKCIPILLYGSEASAVTINQTYHLSTYLSTSRYKKLSYRLETGRQQCISLQLTPHSMESSPRNPANIPMKFNTARN